MDTSMAQKKWKWVMGDGGAPKKGTVKVRWPQHRNLW